MLTPIFAFRHKCKIIPYLGRGIRADEYGAPIEKRCRVNFKTEKITAMHGGTVREVVANGSVWFEADVKIKPQDVIRFDGRDYTAISVFPCYTLNGKINHIEVMIQ